MGAVNSITNSISNAIGTSGSGNGLLENPAKALTNLGKEVSNSPLAQGVITAGGAALAPLTGGLSIPITAGLLGANQTSQTGGNILNGLTTGGLSYLGGTGLNNYLTSGNVLGAATGAAGTAAEKAAAADLMAKGYSPSAAWELVNAGATGAASTFGAGSAAAAAAASGLGSSAGGAAGSLINGVSNSGLIGAALGALGSSGSTTTSQSGSKEPWGPAQGWMRSNIANGQALQQRYADTPFTPFQKQAYNNSAQLGNQYRANMNQMIPQMNGYRPYRRTPQSQTAQPIQFASPNLGTTNNPFGA